MAASFLPCEESPITLACLKLTQSETSILTFVEVDDEDSNFLRFTSVKKK